MNFIRIQEGRTLHFARVGPSGTRTRPKPTPSEANTGTSNRKADMGGCTPIPPAPASGAPCLASKHAASSADQVAQGKIFHMWRAHDSIRDGSCSRPQRREKASGANADRIHLFVERPHLAHDAIGFGCIGDGFVASRAKIGRHSRNDGGFALVDVE